MWLGSLLIVCGEVSSTWLLSKPFKNSINLIFKNKILKVLRTKLKSVFMNSHLWLVWVTMGNNVCPKKKNDKIINQLNFNNDRVKKYEKTLNMLFQSPLV